MKKILSLIILLLIGGSLFSQNLRLKRLRADTVIISNYQFSRSDTLLKWSNDTVKMGFAKGSAADPFVVVYVDTLLGSFPSIDSCLDYIKVKRIASCSPLWLSSPDSVWVTGELRQIDGSVAFRGTSGANPFHNDGTLFMWYGAKAALRAGYANNNEWNTDSIGDYSAVFGFSSKAIAPYSYSFGGSNRVSGDFSMSIGELNYINSTNSFALGVSDTIYHSDCNLIGRELKSSGSGQTIIGTNNVSGGYIFAVGIGSTAMSNGLEVYADSVVRTPGKFAQYKPDHAFVTYSNNTGYPVQIAVQSAWMDITDSTAVRLTSVEVGDGFTNDNDTIVYSGYDDAHLKFTVSISMSGTNAHDLLIRVYNVTDGSPVHTMKHVTMTGATNRASVTLLGYDTNANVGDRYIVQVANTSASANITIYDIGWLSEVTHYR